jgi:hypothetical protein
LWTFGLGWLLLFLLSLTGMIAFTRLSPGAERYQLAAGILLAVEWHLVWAAVSGMETLLIALLDLLVLTYLLNKRQPWLVCGLLVGMSVWVRPDGITLLAPAILILLLNHTRRRDKIRAATLLGLGFAIFFLPYLIFNRIIADAWLPNTYFANSW